MMNLTDINSLIILFLFVLTFYLLSRWGNGPLTNLTHSMKGKVVVITGASRGIGLETVRELLKQGATVIIGSRDEIQANKAINTLHYSYRSRCTHMTLDLTDYESILGFTKEIKFKYGKIDILINNAGSCFRKFTLCHNIEKTYFTNHIGHLILSCLLLEHFNPKGRIINLVTTKYKRINPETLEKFTSISDNLDFSWNKDNYNWMKTYILSKLAGVHLSQYLSYYCTFKNIDVKIVSVHPGFINNHFFRDIERHSIIWFLRDFFQTPYRWVMFKDNVMGAQTTLHCCFMSWEQLFNGGYYRDCHYEPLISIGLLPNAKKLMIFDKTIIEKNNIVKGDKRILQIFDEKDRI